MIEVHRPAAGDLEMVLHDIRPQDIREWEDGSGRPFQVGATTAIMFGEFVRAAYDEDGVPLCFWGGDRGVVWLFATKAAERRALSLHKILAPNLKDLTNRWDLLTALADARNTLHHKWLEWLGFEFLETVATGPYGKPFKMYVKDDDRCA